MKSLSLATLILPLLTTTAFAFDLEAHRGGRGLMPENTLPAFANALSLGVDTLELDTGITRDGFVLVSHNPQLVPELARGPDGLWLTAPSAPIFAMTRAEIARYDIGRLNPDNRYGKQFPDQHPVDGTRLPLLSEVFALAARAGNTKVRFNIETKLVPQVPDQAPAPEPFAMALVQEIRAAGVTDRAMIQSFDWRTLQVVQRIAPEIVTVYLSSEARNFDTIERGKPGPSPWTAGFDVDDFGGSVPKAVKAAGGRIWSPFYRDVTPASLAEAKALALPVVVWTVDERADMIALIKQGVDGIITDFPDRLRSVMAELGMPLPAPTPVRPD